MEQTVDWLKNNIETVPFKTFEEAGFKWIYDTDENNIEEDL